MRDNQELRMHKMLLEMRTCMHIHGQRYTSESMFSAVWLGAVAQKAGPLLGWACAIWLPEISSQRALIKGRKEMRRGACHAQATP